MWDNASPLEVPVLALLLIAGISAAHRPPSSMEGRVSLLEARQMLESQQVWALRAELPPEAIKVISDLQLHVQHDQEQEDRVRDLGQTVQLLQQRLAALELVLADRGTAEGARIPVAPMQVQPLAIPAKKKPARKTAPAASAKKRKARPRVAEVP